MSSIIVSQGELYQIVKKRKLETIKESEEADQADGKEIDESFNELIIENEAQKFIELFEKTFSEETEEIDCEDGTIQDIISKVVLKIKEKLVSAEKSSYRTKITEAFIRFCRITHQKKQKRWQEQEQYCGGDPQTLTLT